MARTRLRKLFALLLAASMTISMVTAGVAAVEDTPDETGSVVLSAVEQPDDISVAGYDGIRIGRQMKPRLTTLVQDTDRIGRLAASELIGLIEHPKTSIPGIILVEGSVYPGGTVADLL